MPFLRLIRSLFCAAAKPTTEDQDLPGPEAIKKRGWRQWSCVAGDDIPRVLDGTPHGADGARLLVVTQSCDLVHESYENEPVVETFLCEALGPDHQPDGNFTAGKNPRSLLVRFPVAGTDQWFRLRSNGRALVPRHRLARIDPDPSVVVTDQAVRTLQRWLINRMIRTAFPDAFNDRTQRARNKLESRLKKGGASLLGLYINLTPWEELPGDQSYAVDFVGLVDEGLDMEQRKAISLLLGEVAHAYEQTAGIASCEYQVLDEDEATLRLLRTHRVFPLDFLSLGDKPSGDLPPLA
jgi:hypothetical protein